jgi:hypothetical protein
LCKAVGVAGRDTVVKKHKDGSIHVMHPSTAWELYYSTSASRESAQKRLANFNAEQTEAVKKQGIASENKQKQ